MHPRRIFAVVVFLFANLAVAAPSGQVFSDFLKKVGELEGKLPALKNSKQRYAQLQEARKELHSLRKGKSRQSEFEENAMSGFLAALEDMPEKFEPKKCASYKETSKKNMASRDPEQADEPLVERAWKILDSVCR